MDGASSTGDDAAAAAHLFLPSYLAPSLWMRCRSLPRYLAMSLPRSLTFSGSFSARSDPSPPSSGPGSPRSRPVTLHQRRELRVAPVEEAVGGRRRFYLLRIIRTM